MQADTIFQIANALAFFSWIYLAIFPFRPVTSKLLPGVVVTLLCIAYAYILSGSMSPADFSKFSTLQGIISLLSVPGAALAGWIHYLAFDLMTGLFIANNANRHGIPHAPLVPCLLLTFMIGPVGLLLFFIVRWYYTKQYFAENF